MAGYFSMVDVVIARRALLPDEAISLGVLEIALPLCPLKN
jgi:hypothetical protein